MAWWRKEESEDEWLSRVWPAAPSAPKRGRRGTNRRKPARGTGVQEPAEVIGLHSRRVQREPSPDSAPPDKKRDSREALRPLSFLTERLAQRSEAPMRSRGAPVVEAGPSRFQALSTWLSRPNSRAMGFSFILIAVALALVLPDLWESAANGLESLQAIEEGRPVVEPAVVAEEEPAKTIKVERKSPEEPELVVLAAAPAPEMLVASGHPDLGLTAVGAVVVDVHTGAESYAWNADLAQPIAGLTKLMSAMVFLDSRPDLSKVVTIHSSDVSGELKSARLYPGWKFWARDLLGSILVGSENPAIEALIRTSGIGRDEFVIRMNEKAQLLGMKNTYFYDPTGLDEGNVSSARDVARMLQGATEYPFITDMTTRRELVVNTVGRSTVFKYRNRNPLLKAADWRVSVGKSGYTDDAGYCLAAKASTEDLGFASIVLLGAPGMQDGLKDVERIVRRLTIEEDKP